MTVKELGELTEEHAAILESIGMSLALVEDSLKEIRCSQASTEQIVRRLLSIRILSHETEKQIARAGELLTLSPHINGETAQILRRLRTV